MPILSTFAHTDLPSAFSWQAVAYMRQIWPSLFTGGLTWLREPYPADLDPVHVVIHHDEVLVAYAAVIRVTVPHDGTDFAIDGVGNVLTATPYRGQGHGRQVVELPCPGGTRIGTRADSNVYSELRMMRLLSPRARTATKSLLTTPMYVSWAW
jgi:hypothetical protein